MNFVFGKLFHIFSQLRTRFFPSLWIKKEQYLYEKDIEIMHAHKGYSNFSKILRSFIPKGVKVLDVGCNKGLETKIIAEKNEVVGIDLYPDFIEVAKSRNINAQVMDFHNITFVEEFDCVYLNNVLEHAQFPAKVIEGCFRALKKRGGILIVGMPLDGNSLKIKDPAHFYRAKKEDVISLLINRSFNLLKIKEIDTNKKWGWEIPSAMNKILICVAQKCSNFREGKNQKCF